MKLSCFVQECKGLQIRRRGPHSALELKSLISFGDLAKPIGYTRLRRAVAGRTKVSTVSGCSWRLDLRNWPHHPS